MPVTYAEQRNRVFHNGATAHEDLHMKKTKIVIAGGGFAGLYAAKYFDKHLARRPDIEVTLIARENFILFTPMLHEVAAGDLAPGDIVNPLRRILRHVNVIEADVQDVDLSARKVRVVHGFEDAELEFEFDHLAARARFGDKFLRQRRHPRLGGDDEESDGRGAAAKSHGGVFGRSDAGERCSGAPSVAHVRYRGRRICRRRNGRCAQRFRA